ncbi:hypothetical protein ZWY2020_006446 [Hordeum vulgare]|nr:hypothetical protein ZWY2020_006446 [Hordeum vulgare]
MKVKFIPLSFKSANTWRYFVFGEVQRKKILNLHFPSSLKNLLNQNPIIYSTRMKCLLCLIYLV